jgi:hypothetical protein
VLIGQQFQSAESEPFSAEPETFDVRVEDFSHVKFIRRSLYDVCVLDGGRPRPTCSHGASDIEAIRPPAPGGR